MPKPPPASNITISHVYVNDAVLLTREQKFPGGFVANIPLDNQDLMERAAQDLQFAVTYPAPRNRDAKEFVGVQTDLSQHDPQMLLDHYYTLIIARANARRAKSKEPHAHQPVRPHRPNGQNKPRAPHPRQHR